VKQAGERYTRERRMGWQDAPEKRSPGSVLVPRPEIRSPGTAGCGEVLTDVSAVIDQSSSSPKGTGVWRCAQGFHCEGSPHAGPHSRSHRQRWI
jgi:hypothetical protein